MPAEQHDCALTCDPQSHAPIVPAGAGCPAWCACGWTPHDGYWLSDHLRDMEVEACPMPAETTTDCRSEIGITTGLVDALITTCRVLAPRDLTSWTVREALTDLVADEDLAAVLRAVGYSIAPPGSDELIAAVMSLHTRWRIYDECGHRHASTDEPGVVLVEDVGHTCADGYRYSICRECCGGGSDYQMEECATNHRASRPDCWPCPTIDALIATGRPLSGLLRVATPAPESGGQQ